MSNTSMPLAFDAYSSPFARTGSTPSAKDNAQYASIALAVVEAVEAGNPNIVAALLDDRAVSDEVKVAVATRGLLAWNENPLEHRTSARILEVLMAHGANGNARVREGDTVAERLGSRLGTLEGNEGRAFEQGRIKAASGAVKILQECWMIMEGSGVDMAEAGRVRNMAMEPAGTMFHWREPTKR